MNTSSGTSSSGLQFTHPHLAVVLGGGFTGLLAAAALSDDADVVIVEREMMPRTRVPCRVLPHPRRAHLLTTTGAGVVESLLPGITECWLAAGALKLPLPPEFPLPPVAGRARRRTPSEHLISCSRDLLDRVIRERVLALPGVTVLDETEAEGLTGTPEDVTGVRVRDALTGEARRLDADLVVDATGRGSKTPERLAALGLPDVREEVVDAGLTAATRIFRAPDGSADPVLTTGSDPEGPTPGQSATLVPIEDGSWLVTLTGILGGRPSQHADRFVPFARGMCDGTIGELIAGAEPLSEVRLSHETVNRRRHYEQLESWPTGFVALGDAVAAFNPTYGQGLPTAARQAVALRDVLRRHGLDDPALARSLQRGIGRLVQAPWSLVAERDIRYPGATGPRPSAANRLTHDSVHRMLHTAGRSTAFPDPASPPTRPLRPSPVHGLLPAVSPRPLITPPLSTPLPSTALPGGPGDLGAPGDPAGPASPTAPLPEAPQVNHDSTENAAPPDRPSGTPAPGTCPDPQSDSRSAAAPPPGPDSSAPADRWPCQGRRPWPTH
ncbi:NAD(P)/FAD-dependent oxidoreductase [Streptomyces pinistramenti]|uniref:NAD(P)/FAD-dependent oxidoreductase n=1 Tax=Streptomyces pinistramenti TaxID=2884812 RepID=UPI001D069324|nr:FAD-dependent monooxygenase [Streptomyces pinistramenti]MCB5907210.1 FAD-dependent monooxygenase [Streptomyces pinistramenti]